MDPAAVALLEDSRQLQAQIGVVTMAMLVQLGDQLRDSHISEDEFLAAFITAEKLGHDKAAEEAVEFLRRWRRHQAPGVEHAEPVLDEFDAGASTGRALGTVQDLRELDRTQSDFDDAFARIIASVAARAFRHVLNGGRDTIVWSAAVNGTRWRRVTGRNPCSFCAMLATRDDYRTEESAMYVVGRARGYGTANYRATGEVSYGGTIARGARKGQDRRRGTRAPGERYHDNCSCTVVEVVGDMTPTPEQQAQYDLYHDAADAVAAEGLPRSEANVLAKMRELGQGVVHDAQVPETQTGGAGGGWEPPRQKGMAGPDSPDDDFGPIGPRGWTPPAARSQISIDSETVRKVLDGHGSDLDPRWTEQDVFDWVQAVIDHPSDASPEGSQFALYGVAGAVGGVVIVARVSRTSWYVATAYPVTEVQWQVWLDRRSY